LPWKAAQQGYIKAFFVVNPSNPPSVAMWPSTVRRLVQLVKARHPDLMIVTDDVYATFVNGFCSLMAELPQNTIGVYSYSKYFSATAGASVWLPSTRGTSSTG
jgi:aspartate 4-decarboxylase